MPMKSSGSAAAPAQNIATGTPARAAQYWFGRWRGQDFSERNSYRFMGFNFGTLVHTLPRVRVDGVRATIHETNGPKTARIY